jgi:uncharacterized membrane protein (GlpM family)
VSGHQLLILAVKGVGGGTLVAIFSLLSQTLSPKRFAGLFSAAPAVALVGLALAVIDKGAHAAHEAAVGMLAGAGGMIAYALVAVPLLRRMRAGYAAMAALGAWCLAAGVLAIPVLA